jgi:DNA-binding MurR/RpiR family transcriptional regulator
MPKLSRDTWKQIRAEREAGLSFGLLASRYGVDKAAIVRRAKAEGWGDGTDVAELVRRKAMEQVTGTAITDPEKRAAAIDTAAELAADVIRRHQAEAEQVRELLWRGLEAHRAAETLDDKRLAFETLKAAKISSETLANLQRMERISYGLDDHGGKTEIVIERSYGLIGPGTNGAGELL